MALRIEPRLASVASESPLFSPGLPTHIEIDEVLHRLLWTDASVDDQLGSVVKRILDGNQTAEFLKALDVFISAQRMEIEKLCEGQYQVRRTP